MVAVDRGSFDVISRVPYPRDRASISAEITLRADRVDLAAGVFDPNLLLAESLRRRVDRLLPLLACQPTPTQREWLLDALVGLSLGAEALQAVDPLHSAEQLASALRHLEAAAGGHGADPSASE